MLEIGNIRSMKGLDGKKCTSGWHKKQTKQRKPLMITKCKQPRVDCKTCGKYSWGGCGEHLAILYGSIDEGKHCMCRSWPGVYMPSQCTPTTSHQSHPSGNSSQGNENPKNS